MYRQRGTFRTSGLYLLIGVGIGIIGGQWLWPDEEEIRQVDEVTPEVVTRSEEPSPEIKLQDEPGNAFEALERTIINLIQRQQYDAAIDSILLADTAASTQAEISQVSSLLEEAVRLRVAQLRGLARHADIDALYERLTLAMPERAAYFLQLAEHRIAMNNAEMALPVLAQIENHHQLGGRARELIGSITFDDEEAVLAVIPLERTGNQFLVKARLDNQRDVALLLDTGASMTIINPAGLRRLGYSPGGQQAHFSTANGVVEAPLVILDSISVGGLEIDHFQVGELEVNSRRARVDGLLGMDFLRRFEFEVDQDAGELRILSWRDG